ncbi:hypothetical protein D1614_12070 [Maribellus luteus]|uniref:Uncharacterized protein n=1 Tax=Maribellus luteus TaxID=2305463 RepID=A0A399T133_9BACT|nr:hypothetical protein D1614_12070 [Maribellus luteus]
MKLWKKLLFKLRLNTGCSHFMLNANKLNPEDSNVDSKNNESQIRLRPESHERISFKATNM